MIFYWLTKLGDFVVWLFKPVTAAQIAVARTTDKCRVCGHAGLDLRCVHLLSGGQKKDLKVFLQARCVTCGSRTYSEPVMKVDTTMVSPAIARTDLERSEDESSWMAMNLRRPS